jgi:hypothetical protein
LKKKKKKKKAKSLQGPHGHKLKLSLVLASHGIKAPKELKMNLGVELVLAVDIALYRGHINELK